MMTIVAYVFPKLETTKGVVRQMSKKSSFSRPFDNQHRERSQTLLKFARQQIYHITDNCVRNGAEKASLCDL